LIDAGNPDVKLIFVVLSDLFKSRLSDLERGWIELEEEAQYV
jgi:hypothetical protein